MSTQTQTTTQTAKKGHRCCWCGQAIEPGSVYMRWRYFGDDGAVTVKMHPECNGAMHRHYNEDGEREFWPGENPRGMTEGEYEQHRVEKGEL